MVRSNYASHIRAIVALLHASGIPTNQPFPLKLWTRLVIDCLDVGPRGVKDATQTATTLDLIEVTKGNKNSDKESTVCLTDSGLAELQPSIDEAILTYRFVEPTQEL